MTLKKCTVTQLDADFWRMDGEGESVEVGRIDIELPTILMRSRWGFFFLEAGPNPAHESLDRLLEVVGFTRHGHNPETAEERVRALVSYGFADSIAFFYDRHYVMARDLAAILAELDRVRETSEALRASLRASNAVAEHAQSERDRIADKMHKDLGEISARLFASKVEVERLRSGMMPAAQRPVDVEAVLEPVRRVLSDWADRGSDLASSRDRHMAQQSGASPNYIEAGIAEVERWSFMVAANSLREALAEAEKIARG